MAKRSIKEVINFMAQCLKDKGLNVSKIIVFGSHAYRKATDESDIDILIVSRDFKGKNIFERAQLTKEAEIMTIKKFMVALDIITMTPEELETGTSLIADYAKNGKVVYAAKM
ncbi:MAG: nucleotidyltransferase domain-containing protein [Thermodesulfobacteriota bacterium]